MYDNLYDNLCCNLYILLCFLFLLLFAPNKFVGGIENKRSKAEAAIIKVFESITGTKFPTVHPHWLKWDNTILELDGFNGTIAIEFSGPLHTKWTPTFERYEDYFTRIKRDKIKQILCKKNNIPLIIVDYTLPPVYHYDYVKSRLYDIGMYNHPPVYIPKQIAEVYRNYRLESELKLSMEAIDEEYNKLFLTN